MRVVVTDPIHAVGVSRLREAGHEVVMATGAEGEALDAAIASAEAVVLRSATTLSADRLIAADDLRAIARAGIGVDNIDLDTATALGIQVVNAPTGGIDAVTEHTIAMAHALVRELPWTDRRTRGGEWPKDEYHGGELADACLGIVGLGRIGRSVAERAESLGMEVVASDPNVDQGELDTHGVVLLDLDECLRRANLVSIHTPLTPETEGLLDADALSELDGGYLINCSRGGVVDEDALVAALEAGTVAGAALDVFSEEPIGADHPLATQERTLLTPHVAGTSDRAQRTISLEVAEQLIAVAHGEPVSHPVNEPESDGGSLR